MIAEGAWLSQPTHEVEHVSVLFLDGAGEVCGRYEHTDQQRKSCTFNIPAILQEARKCGAAALWTAHNHPRVYAWSEALNRHWHGAIEASADDIAATQALRTALCEVGLQLLDHVVCGPNARAYSFAAAEQPVLTEWDIREARAQGRGY